LLSALVEITALLILDVWQTGLGPWSVLQQIESLLYHRPSDTGPIVDSLQI
jgi:hypothetical protein